MENTLELNEKAVKATIDMRNVNATIWKDRHTYEEVGRPFGPTNRIFKKTSYPELQLRYDIEVADLKEDIPLKEYTFISSKGKKKVLYGASLWLYELVQKGQVSKNEILQLRQKILKNTNYLEDQYFLTRRRFEKGNLNGISYFTSYVIHPGWISPEMNGATIEIRQEKQQKAPNYQLMLYLCIKPKYLENFHNAIGRKARANEVTYWNVDRDIILQAFETLGQISPRHKKDVVNILTIIAFNS